MGFWPIFLGGRQVDRFKQVWVHGCKIPNMMVIPWNPMGKLSQNPWRLVNCTTFNVYEKVPYICIILYLGLNPMTKYPKIGFHQPLSRAAHIAVVHIPSKARLNSSQIQSYSSQKNVIGKSKTSRDDWLAVDLPLWKMMEWKSVGMMTFPTEWKFIKIHGSKPPIRWGFCENVICALKEPEIWKNL